MNILIATDSYKGCLSSIEAGTAMAEGAAKVFPQALVEVLSVSDGGEGMLSAFSDCERADRLSVEVHDALMRPIVSCFGWQRSTSTAFVETALTAGLTQLAPEERNPMLTTTYGIGETVRVALETGATTVVIGLGGSSTNDGGMGFASALGFRFVDGQGRVLEGRGCNLEKVAGVFSDMAMQRKLAGIRFVSACDVASPLYGEQGAARVFATQKGASAMQVDKLDDGLRHYGEILSRYCGKEIGLLPGSGAAGGLGAALIGLFHAEMKSGIHLLLQTERFRLALEKADIVLTGEGCLDVQTSMGKVAYGLLEEGRKRGIPVYAVAGCIKNGREVERMGFRNVCAATPEWMPLSMAMQPDVAKENIRRATAGMLTTQ